MFLSATRQEANMRISLTSASREIGRATIDQQMWMLDLSVPFVEKFHYSHIHAHCANDFSTKYTGTTLLDVFNMIYKPRSFIACYIFAAKILNCADFDNKVELEKRKFKK